MPEQAPEQTYRIELRFDYTGTQAAAIEEAHRVAGMIAGEVTAIFDAAWEELDLAGPSSGRPVEGDDCDERCAVHASACDGFCDHSDDHRNACFVAVD